MPHRAKDLQPRSGTGSPFLNRVTLLTERVQQGVHPFDIPLLGNGLDLTLSTPVTFLVGENGSGKSTLLEGLAWAVGFNAQGGSRDHQFADGADGHALGRALHLGWRQKVTEGFFLRAETFFNFATYLEAVGSTFKRYGGRSLHQQSHGESFLALFQHRLEDGLYLLDEPEAALSPQRQLAFLGILHSLTASGVAQFIVATHSPMLLTFPGATVLSLDDGRVRTVPFQETDHYRITREFLEAPERYYRHLFAQDKRLDDGAV